MKRRYRAPASAALILALATVLVLPGVQAAPGDLDASFNSPNGFNTVADSFFADVVIQPADGKILAVGFREDKTEPGDTSTALVVARFNIDGTLDSNFGSGGIATAVADDDTFGLGIALQADGKIVASGFVSPIPLGFFVTRFNANGSLDTGFGQNGSLTINFGGLFEAANGVAIGPGGTIVLAGSTLFGSPDTNPMTFIAMARLDSLGILDPAFGSGGKVVSTVRGSASDVAVLGDGRILVAGSVPDFVPTDFALLRYNGNGTLDTTFADGDGIATADFRTTDIAAEMAIQTDGRIVLAGSAFNQGEPSIDALARFDSNGNLDPSFDGDGKVTGAATPDVISANGVAVQSDGGIVTVGNVNIGAISTDLHLVVTRYTSAGSPDVSFGSGGRVITDFPGTLAAQSGGPAIQSDGKIVVVGTLSDQSQLFGLVARYLGNGAPPPPPPPPPSFNFCVQKGSFIFKFNSTTGAYEFRDCSKGFVLTGTGTITVNSCKIDLVDTGPNPNHPDRNVMVRVNPCTKVGMVTLTTNSPPKSYGYTDNDVTTGSCTCP